MAQDDTKKEALFNEVKGSLFEFLVGKCLASQKGEELAFLQTIDKNYLNVLSQQDRMVRQFYPEMILFLNDVSKSMSDGLISYFKEVPSNPRLVGKFVNSSLASELHESDLLLETSRGEIPLSLKLNKKNAYVNTKSGGVKSFFSEYFQLRPLVQNKFNQLVDLEFSRMGYELHEWKGLEFTGDFSGWVKHGLTELPGELAPEGRSILKAYYARLAGNMHEILSVAYAENPKSFVSSLPRLMGFSSDKILQAICFHDFKAGSAPVIDIHTFGDLKSSLKSVSISAFDNISSVDILLGDWSLQLRIKPMNKFTTTAIKMNCSVKLKRPSDA